MEDQDALFVVKSRFTLTEEALAAALARAEKAERGHIVLPVPNGREA